MDPALFLDMVQVDVTTREGITVRRGKDTSPSKLESFLLGQFVTVFGVEHTVSEGLTGSDTEQVTGESCAVGVDVVESGSFLGGHLSQI